MAAEEINSKPRELFATGFHSINCFDLISFAGVVYGEQIDFETSRAQLFCFGALQPYIPKSAFAVAVQNEQNSVQLPQYSTFQGQIGEGGKKKRSAFPIQEDQCPIPPGSIMLGRPIALRNLRLLTVFLHPQVPKYFVKRSL